MKLAEALLLRADYQRKLEQIKSRIAVIVKVQEGEEPAEDPKDLFQEYMNIVLEWQDLVTRINFTNIKKKLSSGKTLMEAIALRDAIILKKEFLDMAIKSAVITQNRITKSEVKYVRTIDVADYQNQLDRLAKELRELDALIQAANWNTELK
jgi:soluble cytochrome b562